MRRLRARTLAAALASAAFVRCGGPGDDAATPSFARDVAPIVFERCVPCHREGGAGPFELTSYEHVRRRARQIAEVTASRYMPPWLPAPGGIAFRDERRLTSEEIDVLDRWARSGAPQGDGAPPSLPHAADGWELGEPDLVVSMGEAYPLPAEGGDVFRNFVLPVSIEAPRFVEGFEFRPNEKRLVHHATITIDPSRSSRRLDAMDPGPGFEGMRAAPGAVMPDGHFLGWTPGKSPFREREGMSWRLEPGSDLVAQLHMPTTGKPEEVRASIGLYFGDSPPRLVPVTLRLGSRTIDIAAGERDHRVRDEYVLPVDVSALSVYPHAHYLAREMKATAVLPDGSERRLLHIPEWDFNWQDFYRYETPVRLPRGSRVTMEFSYDNSEANPRNPHRPPQSVSYGPQTTDEMGDLYLQVLPDRSEDLDLLRADFTRKDRNETLRELTFRLERDPEDAQAWNHLGFTYHALERPDDAVEAFREALRVSPDLGDPRFNLGTLLASRGAPREAVRHFERVLRAEGDCVECRVRMGNALRDLGRLDEAVSLLEEATRLDPEHAWAQYSLGIALQLEGRVDEAIERYRAVVRLAPENVEARVSLGSALVGEGRCTPGVSALEDVVRLAPEWPEALSRLSWALTSCPRHGPDAPARAVAYAQRAAELSGFADAAVLDTLGDALAASGQPAQSRIARERALALAEGAGDVALASALRGKLSRAEP